jgi:ankyrin repeat protein
VQEIVTILSSGTDVDAVDYSDRTALHVAAAAGQLEAVTTLLAQGANVNVRDRNGATPRDDAVRNRHDAVADALRAAGGKHEAVGELQLDLFKAVQKGDRDAVARFVREIPVDSADYQQRTSLHIAVILGNVEIVNLLLAAGVSQEFASRYTAHRHI